MAMEFVLYSALVPVTIFLIYQLVVLRRMKRHDRHLFAFSQIRRDAVTLICEKRDTLSNEDYKAIRSFVVLLNTVIDDYESNKVVLFNLKRFAELLKRFKAAEHKVEKVSIKDADVNEIRHRIQQQFVLSFLAYTPFLKYEFAVWLLKQLLSFLVGAGLKKLKKYLNGVTEAKRLIDEHRSPPHCLS